MNILITGHTGFLGKHLSEKFLQKGHKVFGVSRSITNDCRHEQYAIDLVNEDWKLLQLVREKSIDIIVHTAGKPIVADCDENPYDAYKGNGMTTAVVLEAGRRGKVKKVLVLETDKVYGVQKIIPTKETAELNPGSPYEFSKVLANHFCNFYKEHYNMNVISIRPANLFGPGDYSFSRIIPAAMKNIRNGDGIPVYEHAKNMVRDFIYIKDAAEMIYRLSVNKNKHDVYNLSTNNSISIIELATSITNILNHDIAPIIIKQEGSFPEIPEQGIDGSRFVDEYGFNFTPFDIAINTTYRSYN